MPAHLIALKSWFVKQNKQRKRGEFMMYDFDTTRQETSRRKSENPFWAAEMTKEDKN
jgi:hypothetical protein